MSYSIFTLFETEADRDRVAGFLKREFLPLSDILLRTPTQDISMTDSHLPHTDLAYTGDYSGPSLGYNYGAGDSDIERGYRFTICYWMAVIGGIEIDGFKAVVYDGDDLWSVCTGGEPCIHGTNCKATIHTDPFGRSKLSELTLAERMLARGANLGDHVKSLANVNRDIQREIQRLTIVWKNEHRGINATNKSIK